MLWLWILIGVVVLVALFVVVGYNRLVRLRNEVDTGWSNIDVQLQRRADLIPNLVETVRAYAAHERGVFEEVTRARAALQQAGSPGTAAEANEGLTVAIGRLFAVAEAYPELKASENFLSLQEDLTDTEDKISAARRYYNATVMRFNTGVQTLPVAARRVAARLRRARVLLGSRGYLVAAGLVRASDVTLQQQIRANRLKSTIVVFGFVLLLLLVAGLIGFAFDLSLGVVALAGAAVYGIFALVRSRSMVARLTGAQEVAPEAVRPLRRLVENVSIAAGLPVTPEVRIVEDGAPNAYAAGLRPEKSYIGVTTGLLATMPQRELEAVLAHEVAHIRNRDTYLMTMALVFAGVIALIADIGFRSIAYGGRNRGGGVLVLVVALVGIPPCSVRRTAPAAEPVPPSGVPRGRRRGRDAERPGGDGPGTPPAGARLDHGQVRGGVDRTPLGGEPHRPGRLRAVGSAGALEPLQHAPRDRDAHLGARGGGRFSTSGAAARRTSRSVSSTAWSGLDRATASLPRGAGDDDRAPNWVNAL